MSFVLYCIVLTLKWQNDKILQRLMSRRIKFVSHFIQELFQWFMHEMIGRLTPNPKAKKILHFFFIKIFGYLFIYTISHASIERIIQSTTVINSVYVCSLLVSGGFFFSFLCCCCCSFSLFLFCRFISWSYLMCGIPVVNFTMQILFIG